MPLRTTRRLIMQEARRHPGDASEEAPHRAPTGCRHAVSGSISLPSRGPFHLSLTVLVHYRSETVFSLRRWSSRIPTGFHVPRGTWVPDPGSRAAFAYRALTVSGWPFQANSASDTISHFPADPQLRPVRSRNPHPATAEALHGMGLGCSRFARHYSGNRGCFLFLGVLRCFSSPGSLRRVMDWLDGDRTSLLPGFPIRISPDQRLLAAPRGVSPLAASFVGCLCQGIHHVPLVA